VFGGSGGVVSCSVKFAGRAFEGNSWGSLGEGGHAVRHEDLGEHIVAEETEERTLGAWLSP
jgi:hypothetical protein